MTGKHGRDLSDEIRWGIELADHLGVAYGIDDYWDEDDEDHGPSVDEQRRARILEWLEAVDVPPGAEATEVSGLGQRMGDVRDILAGDDVGPEAITEAEGLFRLVEDEAARIRAAVQARKAVHEGIAKDFEPLKEVQGEFKAHRTKIDADRNTAQEALAREITVAANSDARRAVDALARTIADCANELEALGGKDGVGKICAAFGLADDDLAQFDEAFGARDVFLKAVKQFGSAEELAGFCKPFGTGMAGAKAMAEVMAALGGPAELDKTAKALGGPGKLAALRDKGGLEPAKIKTVCDDLGAGFIGELMGPEDDPAEAVALHKEFGADIGQFTGLVAEAGFDGKPKTLVRLFRDGCKGSAGDFVGLCAAFGSPQDRASLKGIIEQGGLGDAPDALSALFSEGCGGDPTTLKTFAASFDDDDKRDGLGRMMTAGGLSGVSEKIDARTLGAVFAHVSGEKPTGVDDAVFAKSRADALAKLAASLDAGACADLKTVLEGGGLGTDPDVFAHLVGIGCDKGSPANVKAISAAFAADATGLSRLDDLLKKGGIGTLDDSKTATGTRPECLGHLLKPGCNGDPKEILKLAKALGDTDRAALKGVMTSGELGKHPVVLGKMYQHGCLLDPNAAHDSEKNPAILKDMIGEFADADGPRIFKDMIDGAGFTEPGYEDRLGSVLRHAFTPKHSAPKVQNGKRLRKLADAFDTHFDDLKTTMQAMEAAPDYMLEQNAADNPNQAGKGLGNLIHAPKFGGNPCGAGNLHTDLFVPLDTRSKAGATAAEVGWSSPPSPPKMTDIKDLLMTAASFEHQPLSAPTVQVGAQNYDFDMDHAAGRHSRRHGKFHLNSAPYMGTTQFAADMGETEIKKMVGNCIQPGNITRVGGAGTRPGGHPPPGPKRTPPLDQWDLNGTFCRTDGADGGEANRIGFGSDGGVVKIKQFYPTGSARPLQTVNTNDFIAMRNALTNAAGPLL